MANIPPMLMTRLVGQLTGALRNLKVYPATHATSQRLFESALSLIREAMAGEPTLTFSLAGNILLINDKPVPDSRRDVFANFISELGKRSIGMLVFRQGLDRDQVQAFFEIMAQDIEQIKSQGGVAALLAMRGIANIQVAGISYGGGGRGGPEGMSGPGPGAGGGSAGLGRPQSLESALPEQLIAMLRSDPRLVTELLLKGAAAMGGTPEGQERMLGQLDWIMGVARSQGGEDFISQMANVVGSLEEGQGDWVTKVKLDNPEWRDVIREILDGYSDEKLAKMIAAKAEVLAIEIKDDLVLVEKLKAMLFAVPINSERRQALYPRLLPHLRRYGLSQEDCDFIFGQVLDTKPVLEKYLRDIKERPAEEMLGDQGFHTLRWLVRREEGCGSAFEGFLGILAHPDTRVRGLALERSTEILTDLLAMERFDLVERMIDILSLRLRQEIDATHYPWVLGTLERITEELRLREKHGLASHISANLADLLLLLSEKPLAKDIVRVLSKIDDDNALKVFVQALLKEPIFELVASELAAKGERAVPYLLAAVKESEDRTMRFKTLYVMNKIGPAVEEPVIKALADDRWFVRRNMCILLGQIGGPNSLAALGGLLDDKEPRVRVEALKAMFKIDGAGAEPWAIKSLGDKEVEVKKTALEILGQVGGEASVDALVELYQKKDLWGRTEPPEVKKAIVSALGGIGTKSAASFLMKVARDRDQELATAAVQVLHELMKKLKAQEANKL